MQNLQFEKEKQELLDQLKATTSAVEQSKNTTTPESPIVEFPKTPMQPRRKEPAPRGKYIADSNFSALVSTTSNPSSYDNSDVMLIKLPTKVVDQLIEQRPQVRLDFQLCLQSPLLFVQQILIWIETYHLLHQLLK